MEGRPSQFCSSVTFDLTLCAVLSSSWLVPYPPPGSYPSPYPRISHSRLSATHSIPPSTAPATGNPPHSPDYSHWPQFTRQCRLYSLQEGWASLMVSGEQWWQFLSLAGRPSLDRARSRLPWHTHTLPRSPLLKLTFILLSQQIPNPQTCWKISRTFGWTQGKDPKDPGSLDRLDEVCEGGKPDGRRVWVTYTDCGPKAEPVNYTLHWHSHPRGLSLLQALTSCCTSTGTHWSCDTPILTRRHYLSKNTHMNVSTLTNIARIANAVPWSSSSVTNRHFRILTQRVTFETCDSSDIWSE